MFKIGQRLLWDFGYGYYEVRCVDGKNISDRVLCKRISNENNKIKLYINKKELFPYSSEQENYLKLKYNF